MKYISPSLLALAVFAAAPSAQALSVKDDDVKLGLTLVIQARAEISDAESAKTSGTDQNYSPAEGSKGTSDSIDFYLRRARFGLKGSWKNDYTFNFVMRADGAGQASGSAPNMAFYEGVIGRKFKFEEQKIDAGVEFGWMAPTFNTAANVHSSSSFLTPNEASTGALVAPRGAGVKFHVNAPYVAAFLDIQNNAKGLRGDGDTANAPGTGYDNANGDKGEGLWKSVRVHLSPEGDWKIDKPQESWAGKEGKGVLVGLDYGMNEDDQYYSLDTGTLPFDASDDVKSRDTYDTTAYGFDVVVHYDGLSALAEYRAATTERQDPAPSTTKNPQKQSAMAWRIQAGYAFPMNDTVLEPVVRYSKLDLYKANKEEGSSFGTKDYGASGTQIEVGVNWYLHSHSNKLQLAYLTWEGEKGTGATDQKPTADIIRAQWQLSF